MVRQGSSLGQEELAFGFIKYVTQFARERGRK